MAAQHLAILESAGCPGSVAGVDLKGKLLLGNRDADISNKGYGSPSKKGAPGHWICLGFEASCDRLVIGPGD